MKIFDKKTVIMVGILSVVLLGGLYITASAQVTIQTNSNAGTFTPQVGSLSAVSSQINPVSAPTSTHKDLNYIVSVIIYYLNEALYLLMGLAFVMFVFYMVTYFMKPADGTQRAEAGQYVMYSVIGFFIIISFWGLVNILKNTFNLDSGPTNWNQVKDIFPQ